MTAPPLLPMRTSYRDIALLASCQALLLVNNAGLIAMNAGALPFIVLVGVVATCFALTRERTARRPAGGV